MILVFFIVIGRLQGVNSLVVALASHGITLLSSLLEELQVEGLITEAEDEQVSIGADFSVNSPCSAWRRVKKLMDDLPLLNYLLAQFSTLYRMVGITFSVSTFEIPKHTTFKFLNWSIACFVYNNRKFKPPGQQQHPFLVYRLQP